MNAYSKFTFVEGLGQPSGVVKDSNPIRREPQKLRGDTRLVLMLRTALEAANGDDGWAHLGEVGNQIANQASFDSPNYGYTKLIELVEATGMFHVKRRNVAVFVRDTRKCEGIQA